MKLRLHHIEMCVRNAKKILNILLNQFGLVLVGHRETILCEQWVVQMEKTVFIVTSRKSNPELADPREHRCNYENSRSMKLNSMDRPEDLKIVNTNTFEPWTIFCCDKVTPGSHVDSVFNIALEVKNVAESLEHINKMGGKVIREVSQVDCECGSVKYAIVKSCCGNVVHTLVEKSNYNGWFLPGFNKISNCNNESSNVISASHFDHVALVCRTGETNEIIEWYEKVFGMKRFLTNRQDTDDDGLVIGDDVGMRLKVMEFWKCSESGLASNCISSEEAWESLKIVVAESLPNISNTQIENFIKHHGGPGLQHVGLHTSHMLQTVESMFKQGVKFRQPPPPYYTPVGQFNVIQNVGEDVESLRKFGILLDDEADVFEEEDEVRNPENNNSKYLMQIFTYPIFDQDTFFLEVIQRKGARGFGVGNVTALARSVNAYNLMMHKEQKHH